jgi:hypothetical protein
MTSKFVPESTWSLGPDVLHLFVEYAYRPILLVLMNLRKCFKSFIGLVVALIATALNDMKTPDI